MIWKTSKEVLTTYTVKSEEESLCYSNLAAETEKLFFIGCWNRQVIFYWLLKQQLTLKIVY